MKPIHEPQPAGAAAPVPDRRAERRMLAWLVAGNVLIIGLLAVLSVVALGASRDIHRQRAQNATENIAQSLQQSIAAEVDRVDLALQMLVIAHDREQRSGRTDAAAFDHLVKEQEALVRGLHGLRATDENGVVRFGRLTAAEKDSTVRHRDFFVRARDERGSGLLLCGPARSNADGAWVISLARRIHRSDGSFAGAVYADLPVTYFEQLFSVVRLGSQGAIALRMADLRLVARRVGPGGPTSGVGSTNVSRQLHDALAASPKGGNFVATTALDQVERANSFQRVGDHPLILLAGLAVDEYLSAWRVEAATVIGLALMVALVMSGTSTVAYRTWRRQVAADRARIREGERYRALMHTASDGIHVLDRQGILVDLNDAFAAMLGCAREQLLGAHVSQWDVTFPADRLERLARSFRVGGRLDIATRYRRHDGQVLHVEVATVGVRIDGKDLVFCSSRDVTRRLQSELALRDSEAQLARTGRLARVGGWDLDMRSGLVTWSDETCLLHEVPVGHRPTLRELRGYFLPEARARLTAAIDACRCDGTPLDLELPMTTAKGTLIWVRVVGEAEREAGELVRLVGAIQDITEHRRRAAELAQEQAAREQVERHARELDQLLHERSEMLNVLAHEVRQPLNNASAALQSAGTALTEAGEQVATLRLARAQAVMGQVLANVDNTLAAAALLARAEPIERQDTDIDTLLAVAIADMPADERGRIRVERATATRTASMDMSLMRLALRNLLSNALKYSLAGAPVRVRLADSDEPLALVIEVADGGVGVEPGLIPRLFERGSRGRQTKAPFGHGLGLYIVRRVMELHGGRVELAANSPQGALFRLVIEQSPGE